MPQYEVDLAANVRAYCSITVEAENADEAQRKVEALCARLNANDWPEEVPPFNPDYSTIGEFEIIGVSAA